MARRDKHAQRALVLVPEAERIAIAAQGRTRVLKKTPVATIPAADRRRSLLRSLALIRASAPPAAQQQQPLAAMPPAPSQRPPEAASSDVPDHFAEVLGEACGEEWAARCSPAAEAVSRDVPPDVPPRLREALAAVGVASLYSHQHATRAALRAGSDVVVTTPTSSGKSLCFSIPALELALVGSTALLLFPLNALARDQEAKMRSLCGALPAGGPVPRVAFLSGATAYSERAAVFSDPCAQIVMTSPDMLHSLLGQAERAGWAGWPAFLRGLRLVVLDESHTYSGALGSHTANVLRRLLLAVERHGGEPARVQFVVASATVANAEDAARRLTGRSSEFVWVRQSGAASPLRAVACTRPSSDPQGVALRAAAAWSRRGLSGVVFTNTVAAAQELARIASVSSTLCGGAAAVRCYYASMPDTAKEEAMTAVRSGHVRLLSCTSALEAGVDVPALDCCVLAGYPGSLMALRQRIGRAGRRGPGLALIVPDARNAVDVALMPDPDAALRFVSSSPCEVVAFNADLPVVLGRHLLCAIAESDSSGISTGQVSRMFGVAGVQLLEALLLQGLVARTDDKWGPGPVAEANPHLQTNLRGSGGAQISIVCDSVELETLSERQALFRAFPGAVLTAMDPRSATLVRLKVDELVLTGSRGVAQATLAAGSNTRPRPLTTSRVRVERVLDRRTIASVLTATLCYSMCETTLIGCVCDGQRRLYARPYALRCYAPCLQLELTGDFKTMIEAVSSGDRGCGEVLHR
eukprot:m51a1_g11896 hypothetical protein (753) ;mRNA; f:604380-606775